jgi:purine-nucleoside/S-methyl-5'-thioadenosine phosphorylase / adenosine deaminase
VALLESARGSLPRLPASYRWRERDDLLWIEASAGGAHAAFTTRLGGVSEGPYRSLNLGILTDDDRERVAHNRERAAAALGRDPGGFAMGWQVHGAGIEVHDGKPEQSGWVRRGALPKSDGQVTSHPGVTPLVLAADCVPLVIAGDGTIAAVHCGWRGVAAGIVARAVELLEARGGGRPAELHAALGPAIGRCCYEVGEEVLAPLRARGHPPHGEDRSLDLPGAVRFELERAGVDDRRIAASGLCTSCHEALFFSHRRDGGVTGRQAGIAWLAR